MAEELPSRRAGRGGHYAISLDRRPARRSFCQISRPSRLCLHGRQADLWRNRRSLQGLRGVAAEPRLKARRPRRTHDAERAAISSRHGGSLARAGIIVVNVNPLYTARELSHQLRVSGAKAIVILENFAATLEKAVADSAIERIVVTGLGDLMGFPKGAVTNFVVRRIKKMVPAYNLPQAVRFNAAVSAGRTPPVFAPPPIGPKDVAVLQYTERHDRHRQGRDAAARDLGRQSARQ